MIIIASFRRSGNNQAESDYRLCHTLRYDTTINSTLQLSRSQGKTPKRRCGADMKKILVAYFSHSGNTEVIAKLIQQHVGGDLYKITTVETYPADYNAVVNQARKELEANDRPELAMTVDGMDSYEVVFIGYPNWCSTIPMAIFTFLEAYDFSGKTIIPFCTHGGGGLGRSMSDIRKLCPNSNVLDGLAISGGVVHTAGNNVSAWLDKLAMSWAK